MRELDRIGMPRELDRAAASLEDRLLGGTLPDRVANRVEKQADMLRAAAARDRMSLR